MIGFVIVSHSARLAEGVCELAAQVAQGRVGLAAAGGTSDAQNPIGTDAFKILEAIESVYSEDGVLIFTDLGSAILSAETALELLDENKRAHVHLRDAPLVEGTIAAVSQAAAGATLAEILQGASPTKDTGPSIDKVVTLPNRPGLHARPAAHLVRLARRFDASMTLENITRGLGPADASGINGLLGLNGRQGDQLLVRARGPEAAQLLAEVTAFVESGCGDKDDTPEHGCAVRVIKSQLTGIPASAGIAIGPLVRLRRANTSVTKREVDNPDAESQRLTHAIAGAKDETRALFEWTKTYLGLTEAGIFDAQLLFLEDETLLNGARDIIFQEHANADFAWQTATAKLNARPDDIADLTTRVLSRLTGVVTKAIRKPAIIAAHDLTPSAVKELDPAMALGLCLETGSANAHSVILTRARGIPAVVGIGPAIASLAEGTTVAIDGERGLVWVSPAAEEISALEQRRQALLAAREQAQAQRHRPATTKDGHRVRVFANINSIADAAQAVEHGAEGVGVLRTEFLFLGRAEAPTEAEQFLAYKAIAETLGGRPLIIRTLDVGGDKDVPYIEIGEEANPFLGWRGIRLTLDRRDLLMTQLRAIVRTGAEILLPMVSTLPELLDVKAMLREIKGQATKAGVMIEVPAAVATADQLASEAAFFSIGTNDLVQYIMAADRTNARVATIADPLQPAVLRMIQQTVQAGHHAGISVTVCGEMAADPLAVPLLIGMGVDELSVSAPLIPELKRAISRWTLPEAEALAREALTLDSNAAVRRLLDRTLAAT